MRIDHFFPKPKDSYFSQSNIKTTNFQIGKKLAYQYVTLKPQRTDTVQISRTPNPYAIMGKPVELKPDPNQPAADMSIKINPPCGPEFWPNRALDYTTDYAICNQWYMEQWSNIRFEVDEKGGRIRTLDGKPATFPWINDKIKEEYHEKLKTEGVNTDSIHWNTVSDTLSHHEGNTDVFGSLYVTLKEHILSRFSGEKQTEALDKLNQVFEKEKERVAESFTRNLTNFYDSAGSSTEPIIPTDGSNSYSDFAKKIKNSVKSEFDSAIALYEETLKSIGGRNGLPEPEEAWLKDDDFYQASELRKIIAKSNPTKTADTRTEDAPFSLQDLNFAKYYHDTFKNNLQSPSWQLSKSSDEQLGEYFAKYRQELHEEMNNLGIHKDLAKAIDNTYKQYMEKFMDFMDEIVTYNQSRGIWISIEGLRTHFINRNTVYQSFNKYTKQQPITQ